jgi:hypothetical protein
MIYFLQQGWDGPIKIGHTEDHGTLKTRITTLQTANPYPLRLLETTKGTLKDEDKIHSDLKEHKLTGEWFKNNEFVNHYIFKLLGRELIHREIEETPRGKIVHLHFTSFKQDRYQREIEKREERIKELEEELKRYKEYLPNIGKLVGELEESVKRLNEVSASIDISEKERHTQYKHKGFVLWGILSKAKKRVMNYCKLK